MVGTFVTCNKLINSFFLIREEMHNYGSGLVFIDVEQHSTLFGPVYDWKG